MAIGASNDVLIAEVVSSSKKKDNGRNEKTDQRWSALLDKAASKIKLEEAKVETAKVAAQGTLIHAMNETALAKVNKMKEDAKILTTDTSFMDDDAKAWFKMAWARIMKDTMDEQAVEPTIPAVEQPAATTTAPSSAVIDDSPTSSI